LPPKSPSMSVAEGKRSGRPKSRSSGAHTACERKTTRAPNPGKREGKQSESRRIIKTGWRNLEKSNPQKNKSKSYIYIFKEDFKNTE